MFAKITEMIGETVAVKFVLLVCNHYQEKSQGTNSCSHYRLITDVNACGID